MKFSVLLLRNKKVLLRECKRHTDRSVSSSPYVILSPGWTWLGYPPGWIWLGYPPPPQLDLAGLPPVDRQTDRHVSKHNLTVVLRTSVNMPHLQLNLRITVNMQERTHSGFSRYANLRDLTEIKCKFKNYDILNYKGKGYVIFLIVARLCVLHQIINTYKSKEYKSTSRSVTNA